MSEAVADPGSFRDPGGRIVRAGGRVFRSVMPSAAGAYRAFRDSGQLDRLVREGRLVASTEMDLPLRAALGAELLLEHPRLPFISYPYEWTFALHRRAALHHLDLQIDALRAGFVLADATAYNIQFDGARPTFIDHLAFKPYVEGEPWIAHRQFCMQFLNPLLLWSRLGVAPNAWFRGSLEGIAPEDLAPLLRWRHNLSWTVLSHVTMQAALQRRLTAAAPTAQRMRGARLPRRSFEAMLIGLRQFVSSCRLRGGKSVWQDYAGDNSYAAAEAEAKRGFVSRMVAGSRPKLLVDLGCNSGDYSLAALDAGAECVIGFDYDHGALDAACRRPDARDRPFLPLWLDAANPSPGQGWSQTERQGLAERLGGTDAVIALAFVHHIAIGRNVPLPMVLDWILSIAPRGVIEFPNKQDPMVQLLLAQRRDIFPDYDEQVFLAELSRRARIVEQCTLSEGRRLLVWFDQSS